MNRAHEKVVRLARMRYLLSQLKTLDDAAFHELEDLVHPHEYPGINISLPEERDLVRAERTARQIANIGRKP